MRGNRGKAWEARLDYQHSIYRAERRAVVFKTHPPAAMRGGRLVYTTKGPPDYVGRAGARPVCFDAKEAAGDRWSFSKLARHQAVALEAFSLDPDALVGICLRLKGPGLTWWVDWSALGPVWWTWKESKTREVASLDLVWLGIRGRPLRGADWLP